MIDKGPKKKTVKSAQKTGTIKPADKKQLKPSSSKVKKTAKTLTRTKPVATAEKIIKKGPAKNKIALASGKRADATGKIVAKKTKTDTGKTAKTVQTSKSKATAKQKTSETAVESVALKTKVIPKMVVAKKAGTSKTNKTAVKKTSIPVNTGKATKEKIAVAHPGKRPLKTNIDIVTKPINDKENIIPVTKIKKLETATEKKKYVPAIKKSEKTGETSKKTKIIMKASSNMETKPVAGSAEKKKAENLSLKEKGKGDAKIKGKAASKPSIKSQLNTLTKTETKTGNPAGQKLSVSSAAKKELINSGKRTLKIFLPPEGYNDKSIPEIPYMELPIEYGENELLLMVVDPDVVYANWEIREADIVGKRGILYMRFFDVTGIEFDGTNAHGFLDIKIDTRIGSGFYDIKMHGKDMIAELGLLGPGGRFRPFLRSDRVSIPQLVTFDELGIAEKLFESGIPVGY